MNELTRLSVNINDETARDLRELADRRGESATEIIRRAVTTYDMLTKAQDDGSEIQVVEGAGNRWTPRVTSVTVL